MSTFDEKIRNAASRNADILAVLGKTDYAAPALQHQSDYVRQLEGKLSLNNAAIEQLVEHREKEMKEHQKYHKSVLKRFAYKATGRKGRFDAKAETEEQEYFDLLREEHHAKKEGEVLANELAEAKKARSELEPAAAEHERAQKELDALYESIFAGPTPSFAEEDTLELAVQHALDEYRRLESALRNEQKVMQLLLSAQVGIVMASKNYKNAVEDDTMVLQGAAIFSDLMEDSDLGRTEAGVKEALRCVDQARQLCAQVPSLGKMNVAEGTIFRDFAYQTKIDESMHQLEKAIDVLIQGKMAAKEREWSLSLEVAAANGRLEESRRQLQKIREQIFERAVAEAGERMGGDGEKKSVIASMNKLAVN